MKRTKLLTAAALTLAAMLCLTGCQGANPQGASQTAIPAVAPAVIQPPALQATAVPTAVTEATATPGVYGGTVLFYNPFGGEYYHLDQNCSRVGDKYLPLMGHFTYDKLDEGPYQSLKPCDGCGAPLRPR